MLQLIKPWESQPPEWHPVDPTHPLGGSLDALWVGTDLGGRDWIGGQRVSMRFGTSLANSARGRAFRDDGTSGSVAAVNGPVTFPYMQFGYGVFASSGGAWTLSNLTLVGGGNLSRIALASSTTVNLALQYGFGTSRSFAVTLPTTVNVPICAIALIISDTEYYLVVNGRVASGTSSPGTFGGLDRLVPPGDSMNGLVYATGFGATRGVISLEQAQAITASPENRVWSMFQRRIWVPASAGGAISLVVGDATHGHAADSLVLTTDSALAVAEALHAHAADSLTLAAGTSLTVAEALHAHTADVLTLTTDSTLAMADALHAHAAETPTLPTGTSLAVAEVAHAHAADAPALTASSTLAVAEALHAHAADNVTLAVAGATNLTVNDATHTHTADVLVLTSAHALTVADASHAHTADGLVLAVASVLAIQEALHAHAADNLTLEVTGSAVLLLADGLHAHTSDGVALTVDAWLTLADAVHGHSVDNVVFTFGGALPTGSLPLLVPLQNSYMLVAPERSLMIVRV